GGVEGGVAAVGRGDAVGADGECRAGVHRLAVDVEADRRAELGGAVHEGDRSREGAAECLRRHRGGDGDGLAEARGGLGRRGAQRGGGEVEDGLRGGRGGGGEVGAVTRVDSGEAVRAGGEGRQAEGGRAVGAE